MNQNEEKAYILVPHPWQPKGVGELAEAHPDPSKTLLGDRWLCRGGALLLVGQTGVGKSSASMQQDVLWGIGKEAFGITPKGALKILTIQVENDDGDLGTMTRGVQEGHNLSDAERELANRNVKYLTVTTGETGLEFLSTLNSFLAGLSEDDRPDLIRIDPLTSFIGGNISDAQEVGEFLYQGLKPLLVRYDCGAVLVHHTGKPVRGDRKSRPDDFIYDAMGSSILSNFVRAGLNIESSAERGKYRFRITKRFYGHGWKSDLGENVQEKWYQHGDSLWVWEPCDPCTKKPGQKIHSIETVLQEVPQSSREGILLAELKNRLHEKHGMSERSTKGLINQLLDEGKLLQKDGKQGTHGGRKPQVVYRAPGFCGSFTDNDGRVKFKAGVDVKTPLGEEESEAA